VLTRQQAIRGAQNFVLIFLSVGIVALYSSWRRPIWLDEFFQFAWGAYPANAETFGMILRSTHDFNLGQTGVYMFANTALLNSFGANSVALRLPSLLAAIFLLSSAIVFIRSKNLTYLWQLIIVLAFGAQAFVFYHAGEARPYMPMAAACVGLATYYTSTLKQRSSNSIRLLGWTAAILGCLFHPYVIFYLFILSISFALLHAMNKFDAKIAKSFVRELNPALLLVSSLIAVGFYYLSWGQNQRTFGLDPFEWHKPEFFMTTVEDSLFGFLPNPSLGIQITLFLLLLPLILILIDAPPSSISIGRLLPPILLILISVSTLAVIVLISYLSSFWIVSRQWLGSMSLMTLALVWFLATLSRQVQTISVGLARGFTSVILLVFLLTFAERAYQQILRLDEYHESQRQLIMRASSTRSPGSKALNQSVDDTTRANLNIVLGGTVWPEFSSFYSRYVRE
jgi:hypothetical protein